MNGLFRGLGLGALLLACAPSREAAAQAAFAARDLPRGAVLTAEDIRYEGVDAEAGSVVGPGWETRRVIAAGEALREPAVRRAPLVRAGQAVELLWSDGPIQLRLRGMAMGSAMAGERVMVRVDARRRLEGVAVAAGQVRINGETR